MVSTGERWELGRRPALDGLRGVAVLCVVLSHSSVASSWFRGGGMVGVTIFFTLSGFLITSLLMGEMAGSGFVSFRGFYARRALRLLPALALFLTATSPFVQGRDLLATAFYVGNWRPATGRSMGLLDHTWSLAVEEQFYLLWPMILVVVSRRVGQRGLLALCGVGIVGSAGARLALWATGATGERVNYGSDTHADALLIGCALAIWLHGRKEGIARPKAASAFVVVMVAAGFVSGGVEVLLWLPSAIPWLSAVAVLAIVQGKYSGWMNAKWLMWVGKRSYGLYLWHFPIFWFIAPEFGLPWPLELLAATALSLVIVVLSWRCIEKPCLRVKDSLFDAKRGQSHSLAPGLPSAYGGAIERRACPTGSGLGAGSSIRVDDAQGRRGGTGRPRLLADRTR